MQLSQQHLAAMLLSSQTDWAQIPPRPLTTCVLKQTERLYRERAAASDSAESKQSGNKAFILMLIADITNVQGGESQQQGSGLYSTRQHDGEAGRWISLWKVTVDYWRGFHHTGPQRSGGSWLGLSLCRRGMLICLVWTSQSSDTRWETTTKGWNVTFPKRNENNKSWSPKLTNHNMPQYVKGLTRFVILWRKTLLIKNNRNDHEETPHNQEGDMLCLWGFCLCPQACFLIIHTHVHDCISLQKAAAAEQDHRGSACNIQSVLFKSQWTTWLVTPRTYSSNN